MLPVGVTRERDLAFASAPDETAPGLASGQVTGNTAIFIANEVAMSAKMILGSAALALVASVAIAGPPVENVGKRHPNLAAAQRLCNQAYEKISAAQQANEWDMQGHAAKAKDLLDEANRELKAAAEAANRH